MLSVFSLLSFSRVQKEYFQLKDGTDNVLTLSEAGKDWYVYCESLEIVCNEDGTFDISASVDGSAFVMYVTSVELTVSGIGEQKEVAFPDDVKQSYEEHFSAVKMPGLFRAGGFGRPHLSAFLCFCAMAVYAI